MGRRYPQPASRPTPRTGPAPTRARGTRCGLAGSTPGAPRDPAAARAAAAAAAAENKLDTKYPYVCHAELNAIMNKNSADVKGCSMYVALFPCNECAKLIIQAGIKEVIFMSDKYHDSEETTAARLLFELAGVTFRKFTPKYSKIVIDFDSINIQPSQKLQ